MTEQITTIETFTIEDLETLKVISDPLRLGILEVMVATGSVSAKQVADQLGMPVKKLYYHLNLLEEHGLITVTGARLVSGILEKYYQSRARQFKVDRSLLKVGEAAGDEFGALLDAIFEATKADILRARRQGLLEPSEDMETPGMLRFRDRLQLRPGSFPVFKARLEALLDEFGGGGNPGDPGTLSYGLTIAIYPLARHDPETGEEEAE